MSTVPTLFHEELGDVPGTVELASDETDHVRALRLREGDPVRITDGEGRLVRGKVDAVGRRDVAVRLGERMRAPDPLPVELAFGVARKSRTLWLVEKAVELGAAVLQPVECDRSRSVADAGRSESFWEKARRRAISALKQCGGARLPRIRPVTPLPEYMEARAAWSGPGVLLSTGSGVRLRDRLRDWSGRNPARILLGPEGGFDATEHERLTRAGWRESALGLRTLRFETAAVAALAVAAQERSPRGESSME